MDIPAFVFILLSLFMQGNQGLEINDCFDISEPTVCYHCDSQFDHHCSDPFQYSHYYISKEVYLTECQGCCIKIMHPSYENTERRIVRSCTETLPQLNFTLDHNCDSFDDNERKICLCQKELCNRASQITHGLLIMTIGSIVISHLRRVSNSF